MYHFQVKCNTPTANLNHFEGTLTIRNNDGTIETVSLNLENVAFRGTKLMNTEFVYGCALYTGADTKMSQNSIMKANKFSSIEVTMNK